MESPRQRKRFEMEDFNMLKTRSQYFDAHDEIITRSSLLKASVLNMRRVAEEFYNSMIWEISDELPEEYYNKLFTLMRSMEDTDLLYHLKSLEDALRNLKWDEGFQNGE